MKKIVLIGDIVDSQKLSNRAGVQKKLETVFNSINKKTDNLNSAFTITLGDEFQAVFSNADNIFYLLQRIENSIYPVKVRFSLGVGKITTSIKKKALGMDGPAFYAAREALTKLKAGENKIILSGDIKDIDLLNSTLNLISFLKMNWNKNRSLCMEMIYTDTPIKEIAKKLKISERGVYKTISSGALNTIKNITNNISAKINSDL
ncbi:MAG: hypothetical protein HND52_20080 [Ignavibacteriae bacterium]|nr:hypothetical protein [Ignavibacteriota bacterium]NOH00269.1 hypothetical protein [Ignavibacteriota bacterium]